MQMNQIPRNSIESNPSNTNHPPRQYPHHLQEVIYTQKYPETQPVNPHKNNKILMSTAEYEKPSIVLHPVQHQTLSTEKFAYQEKKREKLKIENDLELVDSMLVVHEEYIP